MEQNNKTYNLKINKYNCLLKRIDDHINAVNNYKPLSQSSKIDEKYIESLKITTMLEVTAFLKETNPYLPKMYIKSNSGINTININLIYEKETNINYSDVHTNILLVIEELDIVLLDLTTDSFELDKDLFECILLLFNTMSNLKVVLSKYFNYYFKIIYDKLYGRYEVRTENDNILINHSNCIFAAQSLISDILISLENSINLITKAYFSKNLNYLLNHKELKITKTDLYEYVGVAESSFEPYLNLNVKTLPNILTIQRLSSLYNLPTSYFILDINNDDQDDTYSVTSKQTGILKHNLIQIDNYFENFNNDDLIKVLNILILNLGVIDNPLYTMISLIMNKPEKSIHLSAEIERIYSSLVRPEDLESIVKNRLLKSIDRFKNQFILNQDFKITNEDGTFTLSASSGYTEIITTPNDHINEID